MNKRIIALCLCGLLALSLTACGTSEATTDTTTTAAETTTAGTTAAEGTTAAAEDVSEKELAIDNEDIKKMREANALDNLLKTKDTVKSNCVYYDADGNETLNNYQYGDKDTYIGTYSDAIEVLSNGEYYGVFSGEYSTTLFDDGLYDEYSKTVRDDFMLYFSEYEYVTSVTKADGLVTIETYIGKADVPSVFAEAEVKTMGEYEAVITSYILDENTYEIKELTTYIENADGSKRPYSVTTVEANVEKMAIPEDIYAGTHGEGRTYTAILDPDTDKERTLTTVVPKGTSVLIYPPLNYTTVFSDRECTQAITEAFDLNTDTTIYLAEGK